MKLVRTLAFSVSLAATSIALGACGGTVEQPQTTASAATKAPVAQNSHGMVKVVGEALGEVPLRAEQRSEIDKLVADAEARHAPLAEGRKALLTTFADQVENGTIDRGALQASIDKITAGLDSVQASDRAAFVKLHDLLDSSQRNAFVDAFKAQVKGKRGEHAEPLAKLRQFGEDLKLTDAQRAQIRDVLLQAHRDGFKEHAHARGGRGQHHPGEALEAFRGDKLDLDKALPSDAAKVQVSFMADRAIGFFEKVLPILTPEQRKIAADKIRERVAVGDDPLLLH
jgi:hypothetical protein